MEIDLDQSTTQQLPNDTINGKAKYYQVPDYSPTELIPIELKKHISDPIKKFKIPLFAATNSLVQTGVNLTSTYVYKTLLVPGPARSYSAIYTALKESMLGHVGWILQQYSPSSVWRLRFDGIL